MAFRLRCFGTAVVARATGKRIIEEGCRRMVIDRIRQFVCGLHGHDTLRHFERGRMTLKCPCGYESRGWNIRGTTSTLRANRVGSPGSDLGDIPDAAIPVTQRGNLTRQRGAFIRVGNSYFVRR